MGFGREPISFRRVEGDESHFSLRLACRMRIDNQMSARLRGGSWSQTSVADKAGTSKSSILSAWSMAREQVASISEE